MASVVMGIIGGIAAWSLAVFKDPTQASVLHHHALSELKPLLSPNASIHLPCSEGFQTAMDRWTRWKNPEFDVIVEVVTEDDVSKAVQYANQQEQQFLAISGGHGGTKHLGDVEHGVGIWMRKMDGVQVHEDGCSATTGGGVLSKKVVDALWEEGKQTVIGACECTGAIAPALGGGHGWLQGRHGLLADQILSARLVLANGTAVTVSSSSHPDLFWAIRGAGHNFGIVTDMQYKVYDRTPQNEKWAMETLTFSGTKLEEVLQELNEMMKQYHDVVELAHWTEVLWLSQVDPKLSPLSHDTFLTDLRGLAAPLMMDNDGAACQHGSAYLRFPFGGSEYNIEGLRIAYDTLAALPPKLNQSWIISEGYSMRGVQSVPAESTAFPDRYNSLLMAVFMVYSPEDEALDQQAAEYGEAMRDDVVKSSGDGLQAYVNYAFGDESQEALYGYESWRLDRLQKLKALYDPDGRFNFYNPILT
ncbi:uncharacterized protein LTR77_008903 [Saxophila tyrrhenica]|uniref:FAD-binding PCMH-type domain-containing protein n=1 Tax=Saxophila tyrrhenica TaxID=1690608 RepID=A0AAV9P2T2_9PEZI|nr:hypothetical protein LTR77_008903 [Saxophila tyrrhenica]